MCALQCVITRGFRAILYARCIISRIVCCGRTRACLYKAAGNERAERGFASRCARENMRFIYTLWVECARGAVHKTNGALYWFSVGIVWICVCVCVWCVFLGLVCALCIVVGYIAAHVLGRTGHFSLVRFGQNDKIKSKRRRDTVFSVRAQPAWRRVSLARSAYRSRAVCGCIIYNICCCCASRHIFLIHIYTETASRTL